MYTYMHLTESLGGSKIQVQTNHDKIQAIEQRRR